MHRFILYKLFKHCGGGFPINRAHFHLSNGARVERLNWRADVSENGLRQSCGL
ncbi:MAG: malonyl-CoA decarboxylase domain-containing protein, partial [Roseomonas sp.]